jgi:hypothetical protein
VALGVTLALLSLRTSTRWPIAGVVHGLIGTAGFILLIAALQAPRRVDTMGVGSFGIFAATLFGMAMALGPFIPLLAKRSPRAAGVIIAAHASLAITAFVLFLAWASM